MSEKLWQVLIADDEPKVCELIKYLVPWDELDMEVAATAANGLEAIEILKTTDIDILITDARMPECDGIELIKWCSQNKEGIKSIVISGYRHFEYAHGALKYGVNAYLLKPINQRELTDNLKEIIRELKSERQAAEGKNELQRIMHQSRDTLRNHFISSFVFDGYQYARQKTGLVDEVNSEYQMSFRDDIYQAIFIKLDHDLDFEVPLGRLLDLIKKTGDEFFGSFAYEYVSVVAHSGVVMLVNYAAGMTAEFDEKVLRLYDILEKSLDAYDRMYLTIGVGERENTITRIDRCIAMAGEAVKFRIYMPDKKVIFYEEHSYDVYDADRILTDERRKMFESCIRRGNREGLKKIISDCRRQLHDGKNISPVIVYAVVTELGSIAASVLGSIIESPESVNGIKRQLDESIDCAMTEDELWKAAEVISESCIDLIGREMTNQQTRPVRILKAYIEDHYGEAVSLESAAEYVNLSPNYVSTIFKKETGISFLEYLTSIRIDAATEMLRKTDKSINEIAEAVGYADVKHFSKLCRKTLGMKPSEYRKLYS